MITLNNIEVGFGRDILFKDVSLLIKAGDRIGLVGQNGTGKTTLLRLLIGEIEPSSGKVSREKGVSAACLPQSLQSEEDCVLADLADRARPKLAIIRKNKHSIQLQMEKNGNENPDLANQLVEIENRYMLEGGYQQKADFEKILNGLGFSHSDYDRPLNEFSGGWRMRAELAKLLYSKPDILLLDEPTNHLDLNSILWLEQFLLKAGGAVVLVSHDLAFLDKITKRTFDIYGKKITSFSGNYSVYMEFREKEFDRLNRESKNQERYIKKSRDLIEKFRYKKNKAAFAQTLIRKLEKMDKIEKNEINWSKINFRFPDPVHCGQIIFRAENLGKSYDDIVVFSEVDLTMTKGERIAFVGNNGCGKTTLVKLLNRDIDFDGFLKVGEKVEINYYAQNQEEKLDPSLTILETLEKAAPDRKQSELRGILGAFLFPGDTILKKAAILSGGEKSRLALCAMLQIPGNLLIMDEPTNHLDMISKEILKNALLEYKGSLIIVSHDRSFLSGLTERVLEFKRGKIREFPGNIDQYLEHCEKETNQQGVVFQMNDISTVYGCSGKTNYRRRKDLERKLRKVKKTCSELEDKISTLESEIKSIEKTMLNLNSGGTPLAKLTYNRHHSIKMEIDSILPQWEKMQEEMIRLQKQRDKLINRK